MTTTNNLTLTTSDILRGASTINNHIQEISRTGTALNRMIQVGLCSVVAHIHQHGDYTSANVIIENLPSGSRTNAARAFVETFAPVRWNAKTGKFVFDKSRRDTNFETTEAFSKMLSTDWLSFKAEKAEKEKKAFDVVKTVETMFNRVKKAALDDDGAVSSEELEIIKDAIQRLEALKQAKATA